MDANVRIFYEKCIISVPIAYFDFKWNVIAHSLKVRRCKDNFVYISKSVIFAP